MTDWFQTLMSGFARAVQSTGANQRVQEHEAQEAAREGRSMSGTAGVAALLGHVAANASSTNTEYLREETIGGRFNDEVPDTAFIVLHPPTAPGTAFVARLVPGRVFNNNRTELFWNQTNYHSFVPLVYWNGTAYDFVPTERNIPGNATAAQLAVFAAMIQIGPLCRAYFRNSTVDTITNNLASNAATSGHYYIDLVFTLVAGTWQQTAIANPVVRTALLPESSRRLGGASWLGNIYDQYDTALKVSVQWPMAGGARQNSWVATAGTATVTNDNIVAFSPSPVTSGMLMQPNFVAGLFLDRTTLLVPELLAFPGYTRAAQVIYTDLAANPLHLNLDGLLPAGTVANPLVIVNRIPVPVAVAIAPAQPSTLIVSRIIRSVGGPWLSTPQDGTFAVGGGTLSVVLQPTTVFADGVQATTRNDGMTPTILTANADHYLTVTTAGAFNNLVVVQPAGGPAPTPAPGTFSISVTTTDANGVIASTQLLPNVMPGRAAEWIESFSIPLPALAPGEMNRVAVTITQPGLPAPDRWQVQVALNDGTAPPAVGITPTQIQIA